jgi:hypothetical protein
MTRPFVAAALSPAFFGLAALALAGLAPAGAASAQTWGQPVYLNAYGRPVGGTPLSEVETRSYVETGRWADGYSDLPRVYVPTPDYSARYGGAYGAGYGGHGYRRPPAYGYDPRRYRGPARSSYDGYRDEWGYNDDRPRSARGWTDDGRSACGYRDCGCGDVYLYDR